MITLHSSIHNGSITLFADTFLRDFVIHPVGVTPHAAIDFAKFHGRTGVVFDGLLERIIEIAIVQEDIRIIEPPVEVSLDRFDRLCDTLQLLIPGQDDKRGICPGTISVHWKTTRSKDLVMFFAYFSVWSRSKALAIGTD